MGMDSSVEKGLGGERKGKRKVEMRSEVVKEEVG